MERLTRIFRKRGDPNVTRIRRRQALVRLVSRRLPIIRLALFVVGYAWMLAIPSPELSKWTYIDENALQPGQVNCYFDWGNVHQADTYLAELESLRDRNATSEERTSYLVTQFMKLGIPASSQAYEFDASAASLKGSNAYAILSSPRASGNEAIVINASWLSRSGDDVLNLRGVATVLALAGFLKKYSLWAKDLVFVISDGYLDGMQAWLNAYHSTSQSNLKAEPLSLSSGVIWTAMSVDYPGHSFSHLGIFYEGVNGRLVNQDIVNSFQRIARQQGVSVILYDHLDWRDTPALRAELDPIPSWLPSSIRHHPDIQTYAIQAQHVLRHTGYQARGQPSGVHGLFHQFRIDAFTLFALPATGPHGFHAIGRVMESTLRTMNNLLERLHASFFFYIFVGPFRFLKIGSFLPSVVLISIGMMFGGLKAWSDAGWVRDNLSSRGEKDNDGSTLDRWTFRKRPVIPVLGLMACTHIVGAVLFFLVTRPWILKSPPLLTVVFVMFSAVPYIALLHPPSPPAMTVAPISAVLKAFSLCLASTVISATSVQNFSLAAALAILLGLPMSIARPVRGILPKLGASFLYASLGLGWLIACPTELHSAIWNWEILGIWIAPFVCLVYVPLVLQTSIVCILA